MIGRTIAHYQVTDRVGAGGMGEVYRARDTRLGRSVALKVLPEAFAGDNERLQRFEREAKLLASLNHPNLATIHGIEHDGNRRVLVLEMVEGEDLAARIARGAIPIPETLTIARQVADALETAHDHGIIHRDLKPANIVVASEGAVKVLDFGLAKAVDGDPSDSKLSQSPTLLGSSPTAAGVILGTAAYMSPEQARGKRVDRRADIFAFGCVLYEMLTGRTTFGGETVSDTLAAVLRSDPEWALLPAGTPRAVVRLLHRCLEKDARMRLRDIGEARIALDAVLKGEVDEGAAAPVPKASRRRWLPWALVGVLALAALVSMTRGRGGNGGSGDARELVQLSLPLPTGSALALRGEHPAPPVISPDGRRVVFGVSRQGGSMLCVRALDNPATTVLPGTEGAGYPFWSPDSRQIGFFAEGKLKRVDAGGGPVTTVCDAALGKGGTWSADGTIVFAPTYASAIHRVQETGGEPRAITRMDTTRGDVSHRFPRFLPDGKRFLFMSRSQATRSGDVGTAGVKLLVGSVDGDFEREIMAIESDAVYSQRHLLFARNGFLVAQRFDTETLELSGEPIPIAERIRLIRGSTHGLFDASPGGTLVMQTGAVVEGNQMTWVDLSGKEIGSLGDVAQHDDPIRLSPDGTMVAAAIFDPRIGTPDVWIYDVQRGTKTRFTTDVAPDNSPAWSPDSKQIIFSSSRRGSFDLYVKSIGGSNPETQLTGGEAGDNFALCWSRDGRDAVAAQLVPGGGWIIHRIASDGTGSPVSVMSVATFFHVTFSPNGRWLAYDSNEGGNRDTYVLPQSGKGRKWQVSVAGGFNPRWVGNHIYYYNERGVIRTPVTERDSTLEIGTEELLFEATDLEDFEVRYDESRLLLLRTLDQSNREPLSIMLNWQRKLPAGS